MERRGGGFHSANSYPPCPPGNGPRRGQDGGFRGPPNPGRESLASRRGRGGECVAAVRGSWADAAATRFLELREGPAGERERRPQATRGHPVAAGNSGLVLSVRAPGLPAAPRPRPRRRGSPFRKVTHLAGRAEVCAERNLPPPPLAGGLSPALLTPRTRASGRQGPETRRQRSAPRAAPGRRLDAERLVVLMLRSLSR